MIGAGGRATSAHYPSLKALEGVEMVAVSELSEQRMADAADRFGIPGRYSDYREMIEKEEPDAVYAIMPPHHLYDIGATVMEMGCHLFIEKPPAMTTEQTRQMALIAQKHNVLTGVTFQRRFAPVIRYGKELCEKRGAVHSAVSTFYKNAVGGAPYYRGAIDILTSDAIHAVDTLRYLCGGEVESVASRRPSGGINPHQYIPGAGKVQFRGNRRAAHQLDDGAPHLLRGNPFTRHFGIRGPGRGRKGVRG